MTIAIGAARVEEADAIAGLLTDLGYPSTADDVRERLAYWAPDRYSEVIVARDAETVLGCVAVHACPYLERTGRWARIQALVVDVRGRRRGIGRALVAAVEQQAASWGCRVIEVTSSRHRADAHAFYPALGYVDECERSGRFLKQLPAPAPSEVVRA